MAADTSIGTLRIGELARRTGVSPELLRAWEQRYGLLQPSRSAGGFRLYSEEDERRVRATTTLIGQGLSAAEAARRALTEAGDAVDTDRPLIARLSADLRSALDAFDTQRAHAAFDELLASVSVDTVLRDVLIPYLVELGERWERGQASVAQEHFASNLIRGRLLGLSRDWGNVAGPTVILACPPGEEHDLALIMFGIAVSRRGRRVLFLGADTPVETLRDAVDAAKPSAVVLAVSDAGVISANARLLRELAQEARVLLCGGGATREVVAEVGAEWLEGDPVTAADRFSG
jgi:MerR family transcriptional regulator, light-induced transcriptional regulator